MQSNNKQCLTTNTLLEFQYPELLTKAMTFKQYYQEYMSRNKDNPLKYGINENLIDLGQDLIDFYYNDFFSNQDLPNKTHKTFKTYSDIRSKKQLVLAEKNLADTAIQLGLKSQMFVSINPNSELKNNPKLLAQGLKALIGAQYFDKNKDLNLLRNLLQVLFKDLIQKQLDEAMICHQQENIKGDFKEFMDKHPEYSYKLSCSEIKSTLDSKQFIYEYELKINDIVPIKRRGIQKKVVEKELFQVALGLVKSEQFQLVLNDSMRSQLDMTFDGSSNSISDSLIDQKDTSQFNQTSQLLELLFQQNDQKQQINFTNEAAERIKRSLNY